MKSLILVALLVAATQGTAPAKPLPVQAPPQVPVNAPVVMPPPVPTTNIDTYLIGAMRAQDAKIAALEKRILALEKAGKK